MCELAVRRFRGAGRITMRTSPSPVNPLWLPESGEAPPRGGEARVGDGRERGS